MDTLLWKPLFEPINQPVTTTPSIDVLFMVLFHEPPAHVYAELFGNLPSTANLLAQSFTNTLTALEKELGIKQENWHWWKINGLTINHLLNIKALNHPRLMVGGSRYSPNAIRTTHGPSWRMVVSLKDSIQAWGIYPGGQSGNPASKGYDQFINDYAQGNYYPLKLYPSIESAAKESKTILKLEPK